MYAYVNTALDDNEDEDNLSQNDMSYQSQSYNGGGGGDRTDQEGESD